MGEHVAWRVAALVVVLAAAGCYESYFAVPDADSDVFHPAEDARGDTRDRGGDGDADADADVFLPLCGNGMVDPGEECDDNNTENSDACLSGNDRPEARVSDREERGVARVSCPLA